MPKPPDTGIANIDGPLRFSVPSGSDPNQSYTVDLTTAPDGECDCIDFTLTVRPLWKKGGVRTTCRHILLARAHLRQRVEHGDLANYG